MKATELRIGNWVMNTHHNHNDFVQIDKDYFCSDKGIDYEPVPLTEEWLKKLGFEDLSEKRKALKGVLQLVLTENTTIVYYSGTWELLANVQGQGGTVFPCPQLKYVHQLQNLYHALTGNELTIE